MAGEVREDTRRLGATQGMPEAPPKWMVPLLLIAAVVFALDDALRYLARRLDLGRLPPRPPA